MSFNHQRIKKLLHLAGAAQPAGKFHLPFALQARILTAWRAARLARERLELTNVFRLLRLFRAGLGVACALTLLIVAFSLYRLHREPFYQFAAPASVMNLALKP